MILLSQTQEFVPGLYNHIFLITLTKSVLTFTNILCFSGNLEPCLLQPSLDWKLPQAYVQEA